jgi:hypothetical protein
LTNCSFTKGQASLTCSNDHEGLEEAGRGVEAALEEIMKTPPTTRAAARAVTEPLDGRDKVWTAAAVSRLKARLDVAS